jgi:hypothetical protein
MNNSQLETGNFIRFRRFRRFSPQSVAENGEIGKNSPSAIAAFAANSAISLCAAAVFIARLLCKDTACGVLTERTMG